MLRLSHFQHEISDIDVNMTATPLTHFNTAYFWSVPKTENTQLA